MCLPIPLHRWRRRDAVRRDGFEHADSDSGLSPDSFRVSKAALDSVTSRLSVLDRTWSAGGVGLCDSRNRASVSSNRTALDLVAIITKRSNSSLGTPKTCGCAPFVFGTLLLRIEPQRRNSLLPWLLVSLVLLSGIGYAGLQLYRCCRRRKYIESALVKWVFSRGRDCRKKQSGRHYHITALRDPLLKQSRASADIWSVCARCNGGVSTFCGNRR